MMVCATVLWAGYLLTSGAGAGRGIPKTGSDMDEMVRAVLAPGPSPLVAALCCRLNSLPDNGGPLAFSPLSH